MDALDIQNAAMAGYARYLEWEHEFLAMWQEGLLKGALKQAWAMMPADMKEELKQRDPQGYETALSMLEGD